MSARFAVVIFEPISNGVDQSKVKCTPSIAVSVVTASGARVGAMSAASSPIPTTTPALASPGRAKMAASCETISLSFTKNHFPTLAMMR